MALPLLFAEIQQQLKIHQLNPWWHSSSAKKFVWRRVQSADARRTHRNPDWFHLTSERTSHGITSEAVALPPELMTHALIALTSPS